MEMFHRVFISHPEYGIMFSLTLLENSTTTLTEAPNKRDEKRESLPAKTRIATDPSASSR